MHNLDEGKDGRLHWMHHGELRRTLFRLAIPGILSMLVTAVYNVVDTFFVGLLRDTAALAATAIVFPMFLMVGAVGATFGIGAASVISRRLGEKRIQEASRVASTAFFTCAGVSLILSMTGLLLAAPLFRLFGATDTIMDRALDYGRIILAGSAFQMLCMCLANIIRSEGAARHSGTALVLGSVANVILDPVFMFILGLGIRGAALATIVSQALSLAYLLSFYLRRRGVIHLTPSFFSPSFSMYGQIMAIGVPTLIQHLLISLSMSLVNNTAGRYGDAAVAAIGVQMRVTSLVIMTVFGLGQGFQPLAGYSYGAKLWERLRQALVTTMIWGTAYTSAMAAMFAVFAPIIIGIFSRDPAVAAIGARGLRFISVTLPFFGFIHVLLVLFQALGKGRHAAVLSLARQGFVFIPAILLLPRLLGLDGVLLAQPVADLFTAAITAVLGINLMRQLRREEAAGSKPAVTPVPKAVEAELEAGSD